MDRKENPQQDKHEFERIASRLHVIKHSLELLFAKITGKARKDEYDNTFLDFLLQFFVGRFRDFLPTVHDKSASPRKDTTK